MLAIGVRGPCALLSRRAERRGQAGDRGGGAGHGPRSECGRRVQRRPGDRQRRLGGHRGRARARRGRRRGARRARHLHRVAVTPRGAERTYRHQSPEGHRGGTRRPDGDARRRGEPCPRAHRRPGADGRPSRARGRGALRLPPGPGVVLRPRGRGACRPDAPDHHLGRRRRQGRAGPGRRDASRRPRSESRHRVRPSPRAVESRPRRSAPHRRGAGRSHDQSRLAPHSPTRGGCRDRQRWCHMPRGDREPGARRAMHRRSA